MTYFNKNKEDSKINRLDDMFRGQVSPAHSGDVFSVRETERTEVLTANSVSFFVGEHWLFSQGSCSGSLSGSDRTLRVTEQSQSCPVCTPGMCRGARKRMESRNFSH